MGKTFNKIVRYFIKKFSGSGLEQELNGTAAGSMCVPEIAPAARLAAAESAVLLMNDGTLPLKSGETVSVFGRTAFDYFTVGYGSGGDIIAPYKVNAVEGLKNAGVKLNERLIKIYEDWRAAPGNEIDEGFWGHWPMSFPEMPLSDAVVKEAASVSDVAVAVIGRAAGEDRENVLKKGSYYLTDAETDMLEKICAAFDKTVVVMNCGNIIDLGWVEKYKIGALLYAWQGGMESGNALADVLTGRENPSGSLPDAVAKKYSDYPSSDCFGGMRFSEYREDVYVGYRYFETFAREKVLFPFGYGLSYTDFKYGAKVKSVVDAAVALEIQVENTGEVFGKAVVQAYLEKPEGKLGNPARELVGFVKIPLKAGEKATREIKVDLNDFAVYDETGVNGYKSAFVLEEGVYSLYVGRDSRSAKKAGEVELGFTIVKQCSAVMPVEKGNAFERLVNRAGHGVYERVPVTERNLRERILRNLPEEIVSDKPTDKFSDVLCGIATTEDFIAGLSIAELKTLAHGEGKMNSALGSKGNAGAFGGVSESLRAKGVPPVITTDGPSGIRLKRVTSLLPCGTALAATFNTDTVTRLYAFIGREMKLTGSDLLLAPGMNIHRNPLGGRNFEYFSEDPYLSGMTAAAMVNGVQSEGVGACVKHFATNNQEFMRKTVDTRISERALREIYLKSFETALKHSAPKALMTAYNKINGTWCYYNYDLLTVVLRGEWGYGGTVITDWWAERSKSKDFKELADSAWRVRAGVNVLMPGEIKRGSRSGKLDGIESSLASSDGLTKAELQRNAKYVLEFARNMVSEKSETEKGLNG